MTFSSVTFHSAIQQHQAGNLDNAEAGYREVLAGEPERHAAWYYLGMLMQQRGQTSTAIDYVRRAAALYATQPVYQSSLADLLIRQGNLADARTCLEQVVTLRPDDVAAQRKLGALLQQLGELERAIEFYRQILQDHGGTAQLQNDFGVALLHARRPDEAETWFRRALSQQRHYADAHYNLGIAYSDLGRSDEAMNCFRRAIECRPDYAEAHTNLAGAYYVRGNLPAAEEHYRAAARYKPQRAQYRANLGSVLLDEGKFEEGLDCYAQAIAIEPHDGLRIRTGLALPLIPSSNDDLVAARNRFDHNLAELLEQPLTLSDPPREVASTAFYLSYQGFDNRQAFGDLARMYAQAAPSLNFVAPHCRPGVQRRTGERFKIGFLSKHFFNHVVSQYFGPLVTALEQQFDVTLLRPGWPDDEVARSLEASVSNVVHLSAHLAAAQQQVANEELDVLVYADIGMDPLTYFLAYSRLAPVQCNMMGHPDTSGIPTIDYYLSSQAQEPDDGDDHYTERLVRFQNLPLCIAAPPATVSTKQRSDFGLSDDRRLYLCAQTLFKIHPEFDALLGRILREDPRGEVVLVAGHQPHWTKLLRERLARTIPAEIDRVTILPRQGLDDFRQLLTLADVCLDTIHFNGGTTTFETLARGTPLVTLPGRFMRSRQTLAAYRIMGAMGCVAQDTDDYVRLAVWIGNDRQLRQEIREKILEQNHLLFGDHGIVEEIAKFFHDAVTRAGEGSAK